MPLSVALGYASLIGPRPHNEDFCGAVTPETAELETKGILAAVADGVGGQQGGREAAESTVRNLLADYYATPDTWAVPHALDTVLKAQNRWLMAQGAVRRELSGMATTLSAVILRGSRYYTVHIGDSRIYRLREGTLTRLTSDHVWEHPEMQHVLKRAIGLDAHLLLDHGDGELNRGDVFLLVSDGVWSTLGDARIGELLRQHNAPQTAATALASRASDRGAQDNCTAMVLRIDDLAQANLRDRLSAGRTLPPLPHLKPGDEIDGLRVEALLHASRITLLYRVIDRQDGQQRVLKTLRPEACDREAQNALMYEEWLARRVTSHYFPQVVQREQRAHLYYLMSWHEGNSLQQQLDHGHHYPLGETVQIALHLLKGLAALHRLGIVHRDIKPDNLHTGADGRLRILDLGVAAADAEASDGERFREINNPGTPSYMAPELLQGEAASASSDLYAVGVTLYQLLTRRYPYGEIEPFQQPKFGDPVTPLRYRADIPEWLEAVLLKAVARAPRQRFETAEEFILALERGALAPLRMPRRTPLLTRDPQMALKLLAITSLVLNLLLLWLLIAR
ncbi:MAG: bifunctional protein-serine/threonine kinase/phosphatase [Sterolibacterium sp.]|jgi:protein phosphatase|nr:bifunctional protein-serine/threonine kinase/phosphatase [Sterolibacterium sp.]